MICAMTVVVTSKRGTVAEEATAQLLREVLEQHDASPWQFTDRVVIDERAIPHSHPVLTLSTRFPFRSPDGVLASYLHEQIHWQLVAQRRQVRSARRDLKALFSTVPNRAGGGAKTRRSTYLHLLVNWLEVEALTALAGTDARDAFLDATVDGPVYGWVYRQVRDRGPELGQILTGHGLLGPLTGHL